MNRCPSQTRNESCGPARAYGLIEPPRPETHQLRTHTLTTYYLLNYTETLKSTKCASFL